MYVDIMELFNTEGLRFVKMSNRVCMYVCASLDFVFDSP
jgi:hypothetical protein